MLTRRDRKHMMRHMHRDVTRVKRRLVLFLILGLLITGILYYASRDIIATVVLLALVLFYYFVKRVTIRRII